jgi:hypothetical protein
MGGRRLNGPPHWRAGSLILLAVSLLLFCGCGPDNEEAAAFEDTAEGQSQPGLLPDESPRDDHGPDSGIDDPILLPEPEE